MSGINRTFSFAHGDDNRNLNPDSNNRDGAVSPISEPDQENTSNTAMENLGPGSVGGGIGGIALGVANNHNNHNTPVHGGGGGGDGDGYVGPAERGFNTSGSDNPYVPSPPIGGSGGGFESADSLRPQDPYGSNVALGGAAALPAGTRTSDLSQQHLLDPQAQASQQPLAQTQPKPYWAGGALNDGPYQRNSAYSGGDYPLFVNPDEIIDDGDDGIGVGTPTPRAGPAAAGAGAGAAAAAGGGLFGLFKSKKAADTTAYDPVPGAGAGAGAGVGSGAAGAGALEAGEKRQSINPAAAGSKKRGWIVGLFLAFIVVGAIVGGAVGGILGHRGSKTREKGAIHSASDDSKQNGDLNKDSSEIKSLMDNKNLHKVFPGVDYTPWGVQYPLCEKYPPSQNNVTRDIAVLSQLTNTVRLYGTDCNQTEMVLHAIDRLELKSMKLWLGVWVESNQTTTDRQIEQLYKVIDNTKDTSIFKGAIVGNEALFRAGSTKKEAQKNLISYMNDVKDEFKKRSLDLPVATSDLGDNWNKDLAGEADLVMSNVHPFFAGVSVEEAASWTYTFWTGHDAALTKGTDKKQVISEVGWPSGGGNDCGEGAKCKSDTDGSVASVENMNQFMSDWVCQALDNGTDYFWFEAFDEPWKIEFNTEDENWEDKWGLMDSSRKLKPGLKIPDCGGKKVS